MFATVLGVLFGFAGCSLKPEAPLRVGAAVWPGYEGLFLARSLGLFEGKAIKLVEYPNTPEVLRAFQNRAIEVAAVTADEMLRLRAQAPGLRAILVTDLSRGGDALIARPDCKDLKDLRGKRVGVEANATGVFLLARALEQNGMSAKDVQVAPLDSDQHTRAFTAGEVDAVVTYEPHRGKLIRQGAVSLFDSSQIPGEIVGFLVVRESTLQERRDALREVVDRWFEARAYMLSNTEHAAQLAARREGVTAREFNESLRGLELASLEKNRAMLRDQRGATIGALESIQAAMLRAGLLEQTNSVDELLEGGLLP